MTYVIISLSLHAKDITAKVFGRLTAIAPIDKNTYSQIMWLCVCDCGTECVTTAGSLTSRNTESCGCLRHEAHAAAITTHGFSKTPTYSSWAAMRSRCNNPNDSRYNCYGGRGITICSEWDDFSVFLSDVGEKPGNDHSLDRIDNNGNYEPHNIRWATRIQQANNTRYNRRVTYNGRRLTLAQWGRRMSISAGTIRDRIVRQGWDVERALRQPVKRKRALVESNHAK